MATSEIPTSFGFPTLVRIFFPGLISAIIACYIFFSDIPRYFIDMPPLNQLAGMTIAGFLIGLIISSLDIYIYQFFEGIRFWPSPIWWQLYRNELAYYESLDAKFNFYNDEIEKNEYKLKETNDIIEKSKIERQIVELNNSILSISRKIREYPYDPEERYLTKRRPVECTKLGNILAEYENYSKEQYGMDHSIFWYHLWQTMPKEVRDEIDISGAKADFLIYISFVMLLCIPMSTIKIFLITENICLHVNDIILVLFTFIILAYVFYKISIFAHKSYGIYIKSAYDLYRIDLSKKIGMKIPLCPNREERNTWTEYGKFLGDYKELKQCEFRKKIK